MRWREGVPHEVEVCEALGNAALCGVHRAVSQ